MRTVVITPPAPVVTWEEAEAHLVLDGDVSHQTYVESLIAAATAHIDGPSGWLGRAIGVQTLEARFSLLSCSVIRLPFPPALELVSVKYLNFSGDEITADNADFELFGDELAPEGAEWTWSGGSTRREAGRVQYRAGYEEVPAPIKAAILMMVADMFRNRTPVSLAASTMVSELLQPYRVYR